jgi:putative oxidoreductase
MNGRLPESVRDLALLVARVVLGVVLFAHGWQKLLIDGISTTRSQFEALGIPMAIASASFVTFVEFAGGILLILGALTPVVALLHLVVMIGATIFVHASQGLFAVDGGWELVGVIASCELILAAHGAGRFSVDRLVKERLNRPGRGAHAGVRTPAAIAAAPVKPAQKTEPEPEPAIDVEPVTAAFPIQSLPVVPPRPAGPSIFGEESPPTTALPEQTASRMRRLPRPVAPLQGRVPRRVDQHTAETTDPGTR